ncbi:hypothetical protein Pan241w_22000 [Gimesia alba]|uniref:Uncharacterized protein n=1 Tax=Gimesia alba TaxID=2527973 RepID=A0A517RE23_9PLAN|nr:hypothetical protein [Gimesia alba]QDT42119.1 hypothetical protein Pan241w_22000 [Gimesia alba]
MKHLHQACPRLFSILYLTFVRKLFSRSLIIVTACLLSILFYEVPVWAQFNDLLNRIPSSANAIVVIDVTDMHASALARKEGWQKKHEAAYVERPLYLPPEADKIVIAAQLNFANDLEQNWELAVMDLKEPIPMRSIARAEGGYVDSINGLHSAWTPSDAYFVSLSTSHMGVMHPANRQAVSRWADFGRTNSSLVISPYLSQAAKVIRRGGPQIAMAIDLKDSIPPHKLEEGLKQSKVLKGNEQKIKELAEIIGGVQGILFSVKIGSKAEGELRIDLSSETAKNSSLAKSMVLEIVDKLGVHLDDLEKWKVEFKDKSMILSGLLSQDGMRRVFSILEIPSTKFSELKDEDLSPGSPDAVAQASLTYFKSVTVLIDDLRKYLRTNRDNHIVYTERYARKIDRLPILNVDEDLLTYGSDVAETLRGIALAKRAAGSRTGVRNASVYGNYSYNYDSNNNYYGRRSNANVKIQNRTEEQSKATGVRFTSWKEIEDETAAIRREMTKRYQVEF